MDVSIGHLHAPGDPHANHASHFVPRENLAVEAIRAERFDPAPLLPTQPLALAGYPADAACHRAVACPETTEHPATPTTPTDAPPGFPRLEPDDASTGHAVDTVVRIDERVIYPPATLGVMIDVFA